MTELGELRAKSGETEFPHIPDWYEWERENVREEVLAGEYRLHCTARVDALPNTKRYIDIGLASLTHDLSGFTLEGEHEGKPYLVKIQVPSIYSCHIEYEYLGKLGDCIDLNTIEDTLYIYPQGSDFSVTKIALATEELHKSHRNKCSPISVPSRQPNRKHFNLFSRLRFFTCAVMPATRHLRNKLTDCLKRPIVKRL